MKAIAQRLGYISMLILATAGNFAFAQSAIDDDNSKLVVTSMAVSGDNFFAGTRSKGVYRSVDGGKVWAAVNSGLPEHAYINGIATSGRNILTAVYGKGMYLSGDNGMNWKQVSVCSAPCEVEKITTFKNKVFAATKDGLYESVDDGVHWAVVPAIIEKNMTSVVASDNGMLAWSNNGRYRNVFYSSPDGLEWNMLKENNASPDDLEVHGNNILATRCQHIENKGIGRSRCLTALLWILSKNGKKWEEVDLKPREYVFDGDKIYGITVEITASQKKGVVYKREVLMSDNRGGSWKKVDENTDAFVVSDYGMQEKLTEMKVWEPIEIAEHEAMLKSQKLEEERYVAAQAAARKKQKELEDRFNVAPTYRGRGSSPGSTQPDYRALSNDRFNARHNTGSYIDSKGGIHIR